jgi:hypothetical protein
MLLDMPAMTFTALALLLFLDERYVACAAACTVLVMMKETSVTTPMIFGAWLLFREKKTRQALYFLAPAIALGMWLVLLRHHTGHWLGNEGFAKDNVNDALSFEHIVVGFIARANFLFLVDGRWIGTIALLVGFRTFRNKAWAIAALVAIAQVTVVTVFGYAMLTRYVLPVLPILFAAMAAGASTYSKGWRWVSQAVMIGLLILGWFWNPPYPFAYEDNLAWTDFVELQKEAADYLEAYAPDKRIASAWPFTGAIELPYMGYVPRSLTTVELPGLQVADIASVDRSKYDYLVVYEKFWMFDDRAFNSAIGPLISKYRRYHPQSTSEEIRAAMGFDPIHRWERGGLWMEIYAMPKN